MVQKPLSDGFKKIKSKYSGFYKIALRGDFFVFLKMNL
ncbi:hypothetical protein CEV31_2160 [Brucella thiophenivorans]|uniref:Uncharacterized protein n=1 Tax=Brucella thiophenivorans TaxID=571255 RepID=A0A256FVH4_9HYPH|nr:hypothetical protein CEV31_2160 [Brucella thiophenivorans]